MTLQYNGFSSPIEQLHCERKVGSTPSWTCQFASRAAQGGSPFTEPTCSGDCSVIYVPYMQSYSARFLNGLPSPDFLILKRYRRSRKHAEECYRYDPSCREQLPYQELNGQARFSLRTENIGGDLIKVHKVTKDGEDERGNVSLSYENATAATSLQGFRKHLGRSLEEKATKGCGIQGCWLQLWKSLLS